MTTRHAGADGGWWSALRARLTPGDLRIRHHPRRGTRCDGRVANAQRRAIVAFIAQELRPAGPVTVIGRREAGGLWRFRISGRLDPGQTQRLRNTLLDLLR